ncbi:MAG: hypothetical protein WBQ76_16735 [Candidatus Korobacteraceae bacterium]
MIYHTDRRAVAFLLGCDELNAGPEYDKSADDSLGKRWKYKMQLWINGHPDQKGKFHRFKSGEKKYDDCFAFVDVEAKARLYGFSCHPLPKTNERFELIVVTSHAFKKENETDKSELDRVLMWKNHMATKAALSETFPDKAEKEDS